MVHPPDGSRSAESCSIPICLLLAVALATVSVPAIGSEPSPSAVCAANTATLCFQSGRFSVTLAARDQRTGKTGAGQAIPRNDMFGYFSIPALTSDPSNPEVFVKVLDGRPVNGKWWVFYGGLTDLEYTLTVRDGTTGIARNYKKAGGSACGGFDTGAFAIEDPEIANEIERTAMAIGPEQPAFSRESFDQSETRAIAPNAACAAGIDRLCLNASRFQVMLMSRDQRTGRYGAGQAIPQNNLFGYFSIPALTGNAGNPEVFVKVLDGRGVNGKFWVFYGSLTDLELTITITDTATGAIRKYTRNGGSACGGFDTNAFDPGTQTYSLTVARNGSGQGTVTGTGINCGSDCTQSFNSGTVVALTAAAAAGSSFAGWSGCDTVSGATCTATMKAARTVTATFNATAGGFGLSVVKNGAGTGTVSGTGISCGNDCTETYASGTSVSLTATPAAGSTLGGFSGCDTVSGNVCSVKMTANRKVTATFNASNPNYVLTVTKKGTGQGTVSGAGISCGAVCSASLPGGTSLTLTAAPSSGATFAGWTGCDTASGSTCNVKLTANRTVTATFNGATSDTVNFAGGPLSALKALSSTLTFKNLNITGVLSLGTSDGTSITIRATNLTIPAGGGISFSQSDCSYRPAPDVLLIASGTLKIDGGHVRLYGKSGAGTTQTTTCHSCTGVRGGNVGLQGAVVALGQTASTDIDAGGGNGSRFYAGDGIYVGCEGGNGGTITISGTSSITIGRNAKLDVAGGSGGYGSGGGGNGRAGADGKVVFAGTAVPTMYETSTSNAFVSMAQVLSYQRLDLYGGANLDDDADRRTSTQARFIIFNSGARDFCEDLYVVRLATAATMRIGLSSTATGDFDLYLGNSDMTALLGSSNGPTSTELINYPAGPGSYVVCVSWADDNALGSSQPVPYKLSLGP